MYQSKAAPQPAWALQPHSPSYLNLVLTTLLLSYFPGQGLLLGSELLDVHLFSTAFSLRIIFKCLNPHIIFLLPGNVERQKNQERSHCKGCWWQGLCLFCCLPPTDKSLPGTVHHHLLMVD